MAEQKIEMRFTGSGGQGVILASIIFADAAILEGRNALQSQSYGPEARGGTSKAETIIGSHDLDYSKVTTPDFLLSLNQDSLNKYCTEIKDTTVVMIDSSLTIPESLKGHNVVALPILSTARDTIGKSMVANIVAVGAINATLGLFPEEILQEAVKAHIPAGTEQLNMLALKEGERIAQARQEAGEAFRIRCPRLMNRIVTADQAASMIEDGFTVAVSGFTPSGCPKAVTKELARQAKEGRNVKITLLSGASTGEEIDSTLAEAGVIAKRAPYITSKVLRKTLNDTGVLYQDAHLGDMAQNTRYGFYGHVDIALIEACAITEDGGIVPTTAIGASDTFVKMADKVIVEMNLTQPAELEGLHDIYPQNDPPARQPIPITSVDQRIGDTCIHCDPEKIAAVVISEVVEMPRALAKPDEVSQKIADNIVAFLEEEKKAGRLSADVLPLQSGVGNVANAVLAGLKASDFTHLNFYSEVMQDAILDLIDCGKADYCSATSVCLSREYMDRFMENLSFYKRHVVLRDSEVSNNGEVIRRLGVIAMNTAIEADIYGNVNSSHMMGTRVYNGIGGSCDYARGAALTIFMTASTAKDGKISSIVPMVTHVDSCEHDVDVIVTEQGLADLRGLAPKERVERIIENCAHPDYRPLLWDYYHRALEKCGPVQTPHLLKECFSFHTRFEETGTMLK